MVGVLDIQADDNKKPAAPTAKVTATRIGGALRERFEEYIHKDECAQEQADYEDKMTSRAISAFVVAHIGKVDDKISGESVCDSTYDGGIDAVLVNHTEKLVIVVQSKYNKSGSKTWSKRDFLDFKTACEHLQSQEFNRFDKRLKAKTTDIVKALDSIDYKFVFAMAHTGKQGAADEILDDMKQWQGELNDAALVDQTVTANSDLPFQVHLVSAEDLMDWLRHQVSGSVDLDDVELAQYGRVEAPYTAYYGIVSGDQIAEWWGVHGSALFSQNIRNLLGKTEVNDSIRETAKENPDNFWYFNNGITVLVNKIAPHRRNNIKERDRGLFSFKAVSVVNGAQTVSSIGAVSASCEEEEMSRIKVHARFICVNDEHDLIGAEITRSNNHQNRVLGRDFASQEANQLRLRDELIVEGCTYRLLRTELDEDAADDVIDIDEALDALVCMNGSASSVATLKSKRGRFFENLEGSLYQSVFNPSVSGVLLLNAVKYSRVIQREMSDLLEKQNDRRRVGILTHANKVFASIVMNNISGLKKSDKIIKPDNTKVRELLGSMLEIAETYMTSYHSNAYPARFFTNLDKVTEISDHLKEIIERNRTGKQNE